MEPCKRVTWANGLALYPRAFSQERCYSRFKRDIAFAGAHRVFVVSHRADQASEQTKLAYFVTFLFSCFPNFRNSLEGFEFEEHDSVFFLTVSLMIFLVKNIFVSIYFGTFQKLFKFSGSYFKKRKKIINKILKIKDFSCFKRCW